MKLEKISDYAVIIIALSALFVSIWQVRLGHQHNKLSVKPYLDHHIVQTDSMMVVSFSNNGFGPAIIKEISFFSNGQKFDTLEEYLKSSGEIKNRKGSYNYGEGTIVASNSDNLVVKLVGTQLRDVEVRIRYVDIYEEEGQFNFSF